jgi:CRISPR-associated protein Cas5t
MTLMRTDLPAVDIALGAVVFPEVQTMYQQLHNYPVGDTGKEHRPSCKGAKYNIQPIRREFLSGIDAYICLRNNAPLEETVRRALKSSAEFAESGLRRYGVPFLGDNNFVIDRVEEEAKPEKPAFWYRKVQPSEKELIRGRCRLTSWIDRTDMSCTAAALYAPIVEPERNPPAEAWTRVPPPRINDC